MKKPLPIPVIVLTVFAVLIIGYFAYGKVSEDPVVTGTKTGYGPGKMPPPPSFKIPPMPGGASAPGGAGGNTPPPAGMRPPDGQQATGQ